MKPEAAPAPSPPRRSRLAAALGITDRAGFVTPIWQSLATGVIFVAVGLIGFHAPHPRHARIDITGPRAAVSGLEAGLQRATPGGFDLRTVPTAAIALRHLRTGQTYGAITLGSPAALKYAGANGPTVTATLTHLLPAVAARAGVTLRTVDALPLRRDDTAGLPLFYLTFGVILASYLFAVTSAVIGIRLPPRGHWASAAVLGAALGVSAALLGRYATHTIDTGTVPAAAGLLALASLGTSSASWLLLRASAAFGSLAASIIFVVLGSASGGVVPGEFLPAWLAAFRPILPMGAALSGIRDAVYFAGTHALREAGILALWCLLPAAYALAGSRRGRSRDAASPVTRPEAA